MKTINILKAAALLALSITGNCFAQCSIAISHGDTIICEGDTVNLTATGITNYALQFDGVDDYVNMGDPANGNLDFGTGDFTWEFWVSVSKTSPANNEWPILAKTGTAGSHDNGFDIEVSSWGGLSIGGYFTIIGRIPDEYASAGGVGIINPNQWYHIAYTRSGTTVKAYLDGVLKSTTTNADMGTDIGNAKNFQIGENTWGNGYFGGTLDEIRIWNTCRSAAEISSSMSKTLNGNESGLVAYWRVDEGTGTTLVDATGKGNTGTLTKEPVWVTSAANISPAYSWSPATGLSDTIGATITAKPTATTTYTVKGTGGCNPATVTIKVKPLPTASITGTTSICKGDSTVLTTSGGTGFQWSTGDTTSFVTIKPQTDTSVFVTVTDINACSATSTKSIIVNSLPPSPSITQNGNVLTSGSATGNQWYRNDTLIVGATAPTYIATANGNYTVVVTNTNGCSSASAVHLINTGIPREEEKMNGFSIFPNPSEGTIVVSFSALKTGDYTIEIINAIGQTIYNKHLNLQNGSHSQSLDLTEFGKGIYLISLKNSDNRIIKKIVIE